MGSCAKCQSQSTTFKEGVSKKTGKPWKAYKCDDCGEMNWVFTKGTAQKSAQAPSGDSISLLKAILKELRIMNGTDTAEANKELQIESKEETEPF